MWLESQAVSAQPANRASHHPLAHPSPPQSPRRCRPALQYFLEILQNRKSDTLEWIIIILIGAEICLSLYDLASKGFS